MLKHQILSFGPRSIIEAKKLYKNSKPWVGELYFPKNGRTYRFEIGSANAFGKEKDTQRLLIHAKFEDGDAQDFYWDGRKQLWNSLNEASKTRIEKAVEVYLEFKNVKINTDETHC